MSRFDQPDPYPHGAHPYARRDDPRYDASTASSSAHSPSSSPSSAYPYDADDDAPDADDDPHAALTSQTLNADGTPKRPMNAFMIYARRRRPQISAQNQMMRTGDISKILSKEWAGMDMSDKKFYLDQAKKLKDAFNARYPDYVYRRRPNNSRRRRKPDADPAQPSPPPSHTDSPSPPADDALAFDHAYSPYPYPATSPATPHSPDTFPFLPQPDLRLAPAAPYPAPYSPAPSSGSPGAYAPWDARPAQDAARWPPPAARAPALAGSLSAPGPDRAYSPEGAQRSWSAGATTNGYAGAYAGGGLAPAFFPAANASSAQGTQGRAAYAAPTAPLNEWYRLPALQGQNGQGERAGAGAGAGAWWERR